MNGWLNSHSERERCIDAVDVFLHKDLAIPRLIVKPGVKVVGFMDECEVRQSAEFMCDFRKFLSRINEHAFYFMWMPDGYTSSTADDAYLIYSCDSLSKNAKNFVRLQSDNDEKAFESDAWIVVSSSCKWAVYGEQYGSEMALLLSRDEPISKEMMALFTRAINDPLIALAEIGDQTPTEVGERFKSEFLRNYSG